MPVTFLLVHLCHYMVVAVLASKSLAVPGFTLVALPRSITSCFLVILPLTDDRSFAMYPLSRITRSKHDRIDVMHQTAVWQTSILALPAIDRRIIEQSPSGSEDRMVEVQRARQGKRLMRLGRFVAATFGIDPDFVRGFASLPNL